MKFHLLDKLETRLGHQRCSHPSDIQSPEIKWSSRRIQNIKKEMDICVQSLLDEVETDQANEELDEMMDINRDSESKLEKSDEHETFELKGKFSNAT
ncbi:hypothetical protein TNCV_301751 [Trichonephila clavipes]|nr:hypothetical protein TNCV_301751 [Trichonephila clavipes]